MKICLIGEFSCDLDEAMRKVSYYFSQELKNNHQILTLDVRNINSISFWKRIREFSPEIVHYLYGPSIKSFLLLKIISIYYPYCKTVIYSIHPLFSSLTDPFIRFLKPNLILTLSCNTELRFKKLGCRTKFLPCGVDIDKFRPADLQMKIKLRHKYNIDPNKFVILHIGSIKVGRNVQLIEKLKDEDTLILIVSAISPGAESNLIDQLKRANCMVLSSYLSNIEEIYMLSDCYVFPTLPENNMFSIEMPLTVLEAMSSNLPVITTKFGALPRIFDEGHGLFFVEVERDYLFALEAIKGGLQVETREKALMYSWKNVVNELEDVYEKL
jgi:glycosyltransferase involved in cell wall biosynthesis